MADVLKQAGRWLAGEAAFEAAIPVGVACAGWTAAHALLAAPVAGAPATRMELLAVLGAGVALSAWAVARQFVILGRRRIGWNLLTSVAISLGLLAGMGPWVRWTFADACTSELGGVLQDALDPVSGAMLPVCRLHAVPGNRYAPGATIPAGWSGELPAWTWVYFAGVAALSVIGLRDVRLRRSHIAENVREALAYAPAVGRAGLLGAGKSEEVVACANPTLWGEPCGQLYAKDDPPSAGAWCTRCQQVFRPAERNLVFAVYSMRTREIDVLNGVERVDAMGWRPGEPIPPETRISGQERWLLLGRIELPDVLTVAQALALIHARLDGFAETLGPEGKEAVALAKESASRLCAWIWVGRVSHRLTYARPAARVVYGERTARLADLVPDTGEELGLQLDVGLLPVELRTGILRTFRGGAREPVAQNTRLDVWLPVAPPKSTDGEWVVRVEGAALRRWLAVERSHEPGREGVVVPLGYRPVGGAETVSRELLDLVLLPVEAESNEVRVERRPGDSLAEWTWLEREQIEALRNQAVVMLPIGGGRA